MHTPGPWRLDDIWTDSIGVVRGTVWGADNSIVCDNEQYYPHSVKVDDMKLISAVFELLEALEAIVPSTSDWWCPTCKESLSGSRVTYQECCDTCGTFLGGVDDPEWITKARAAIAKAKGE